MIRRPYSYVPMSIPLLRYKVDADSWQKRRITELTGCTYILLRRYSTAGAGVYAICMELYIPTVAIGRVKTSLHVIFISFRRIFSLLKLFQASRVAFFQQIF